MGREGGGERVIGKGPRASMHQETFLAGGSPVVRPYALVALSLSLSLSLSLAMAIAQAFIVVPFFFCVR